MINGNVEYVVEGWSSHTYYRVYRHDRKYVEGEMTWIKNNWDGSYKKVCEDQLVQQDELLLTV
jgi:hypothetical protein